MEEIERGWLTDPIPLTDKIACVTSLTTRCVIRDQHGEYKGEFLVIGELEAIGITGLLAKVGTNIPDKLDIPMAATTYYKLIEPRTPLRASR